MFSESEGILEGCRKFRSWLINFGHLSSHSINYDSAQSLFTTCDVEECVLRISDWHIVDSSTSNTYDSQISDWHIVDSSASNTYDSQYSCSCCCGSCPITL